MEIKYPVSKTNILVISDCHIPYHHKHTIDFLKRIKKVYKPQLVISIGDFLDFHNISFHTSDPDLLGAGDELKKARKTIKEIEKLFPDMYIIGSNHGDLPLRKAVDAGLPRDLFRSYNDIYGVSDRWKFVDDLTLDDKGKLYYFAHGISKSGIKLAAQRGLNVSQGHFHTEFRIDYVSNPKELLWSMQVGCLIDSKSLAFAYDKLNLNRPIIGCGAIVKSLPELIPMQLDSNGSWIYR